MKKVVLMKRIQKIILIIYGILVITVCTYVPWMRLIKGYFLSLGYSPTWSPIDGSIVDIRRVILELIAITVLCCISFLLTLDSKFGD